MMLNAIRRSSFPPSFTDTESSEWFGAADVFVFDVSCLLHDGESDDDEDDEQFGGLDDMIFDLISFTLFLLCSFRFSLYVFVIQSPINL